MKNLKGQLGVGILLLISVMFVKSKKKIGKNNQHPFMKNGIKEASLVKLD